MNNEIDELKLQRLVDGEMDDAARHAFLAELETRPGAWRDVALAFVEEQVFSATVPDSVPVTPQLAVLPARRHRLRPWVRGAALAATLLLGLLAGFVWGHDAGQSAAATQYQALAPESGPAEAAPDNPEAEAATTQAEYEERLKALGYRLEASAQYLAGTLKDGRSVIVPVSSVQVGYHGV